MVATVKENIGRAGFKAPKIYRAMINATF